MDSEAKKVPVSEGLLKEAMMSKEKSTGTLLKYSQKNIDASEIGSGYNHSQDSVPKPKGRAIVPQQARVQVGHKGIKTAIKFQRIKCTKCLTSPDNHQKEKDHTCKA